MNARTERTTAPARAGRLLVYSLVGAGALLPFEGAAAGRSGPGEKAAPKPPVILLTGFEPFGRTKPPNPSWEAIKDLDGKDWKGFRLVCKQIPVVWGAPREHLQKWIDQYQPVAIFAFGQGGPDGFTFESKASNWRGKKNKDNAGKRPPTPAIVDGGPDGFDATIACDQLARSLQKKHYLARVSTKAGRYLCEEMLYTLEYLKATRPLAGTVMFCHVPALNGFIPCDHLTKEYLGRLAALTLQYHGKPPPSILIPARYVRVADVHRFVKDTLEAWYTLYREHPTARTGQAEAGESRAHKEIKEFIGRYFRTWSEQDMKGYEACFLPEASIQHISTAGRLTTTARPQFIASQRNYHRNSPVRTTEVAENVDIRLEERLARVVVFWKLTAGARTEWGYDHFTLIRQDGQWRIVNLVFYETPPPGKGKKSER